MEIRISDINPCAIPLPDTPSTSFESTDSPTINVPSIFVKNNSVISKTPAANSSIRFTIPVAPDCFPVTE